MPSTSIIHRLKSRAFRGYALSPKSFILSAYSSPLVGHAKYIHELINNYSLLTSMISCAMRCHIILTTYVNNGYYLYLHKSLIVTLFTAGIYNYMYTVTTFLSQLKNRKPSANVNFINHVHVHLHV